MRTLFATIAAVFIVIGQPWADDLPIVEIRDGRLHPAVLQVHVGEVVRWQAPPGRTIRIELDRHPTAHEAAERAGEIHAVFRKTGEHTYVVTILPSEERFRGTVRVGEGGAWTPAFDCGDGSSGRVCFMP